MQIDQIRVKCDAMKVKPNLSKDQIEDMRKLIEQLLTTYSNGDSFKPDVYFNTTLIDPVIDKN